MLKINHLHKSYVSGTTSINVLEDVSFTVEKGEFVAVMGLREAEKLRCLIVFPVLPRMIPGKYSWTMKIYPH